MEKTAEYRIDAMEVITDTTTFEAGQRLSAEIDPLYRERNAAVVSMQGINNVSSSFLHGAIGVLIDKYGVEFVKAHTRFVDLSRFIKKQLLHYFEVYEPHRSGPNSPSTTS